MAPRQKALQTLPPAKASLS